METTPFLLEKIHDKSEIKMCATLIIPVIVEPNSLHHRR
jgi:hypothetical protein